MKLTRLYLRLGSDERNQWYEDFRRYYLRNQDSYPKYQNRASSDMQKMFIEHINFMETNINEFSPSGNVRYKQSYADHQLEQLVDAYLLEKYTSRKEYLEEYYPECLI